MHRTESFHSISHHSIKPVSPMTARDWHFSFLFFSITVCFDTVTRLQNFILKLYPLILPLSPLHARGSKELNDRYLGKKKRWEGGVWMGERRAAQRWIAQYEGSHIGQISQAGRGLQGYLGDVEGEGGS